MTHPLLTKLTRTLRSGVPPIVLVPKILNNTLALGRGRFHLTAFDRLGARPRVFGPVCVTNRGSIVAGDDLALGGRFGAVSLSAERGATLRMGRSVTINYGAFVDTTWRLSSLVHDCHRRRGDDRTLHVIADADVRPALTACHSDRAPERLTGAELHTRVRRLASALRRFGVRPGDRVVAITRMRARALLAAPRTPAYRTIWNRGGGTDAQSRYGCR